ncbi:MAG TPA: hypothetical protein VEC37_14325, partial [Bacillota bacterium]|nr:hypothetical protein [Bacillota bacterium]
NYAQLFNGLEKSLDGEGWQTQNLTLGRMALKSAYALMDEEAQEQILAQVQHAQCFIAHKTETGSLVSVSSLVIKDPQFASTYLKLLEAMVRKNIKALESSPSIQIQDFTISDFAAYPTDQTQKIVMTVVDKNSSSSARQVFVRIFKDKLMLEILISNYEMDDVTIAELAREVFERYQKLIKD